MPSKASVIWVAATLLAQFGRAIASPVPDWPRPPSETDCEIFRDTINAFYERADADYRGCYNDAGSCGDAPARRGAAAAKKAEVPVCFAQAKQRFTELKDLYDLVQRSSNYSQLSSEEKAKFHTDWAKSINSQGRSHELSKKLTDDALDRLAATNKKALSDLDGRLKQIGDSTARPPTSKPTTDWASRVSAAKNRAGNIDEQLKNRADQLTQDKRNAQDWEDTRNCRLAGCIQQKQAIQDEYDRRYAEDLRKWQAEVDRIRRERELAAMERYQQELEMRQQIVAQFGNFMSVVASNYRTTSPTSINTPSPTYGSRSTSPSSSAGSGLRCRPGESIERCVHR
ncbi:hypothetical protein [Tardiphaga sp. 11_C7_N12_6]|uniref:hypothetical protein n=1 Tax=Tardiphaga sp. 11_C7_N12_6 TaxID=3240789 RepID=UPI003F277B72